MNHLAFHGVERPHIAVGLRILLSLVLLSAIYHRNPLADVMEALASDVDGVALAAARSPVNAALLIVVVLDAAVRAVRHVERGDEADDGAAGHIERDRVTGVVARQ
jgi:hypothetical protein